MGNIMEQVGQDSGDIAVIAKKKRAPWVPWGSKDESSVFAIADNYEEYVGSNSGDPNPAGGVYALGGVPALRRQQADQGTPGYPNPPTILAPWRRWGSYDESSVNGMGLHIADNIEETEQANSGDPNGYGGVYAVPAGATMLINSVTSPGQDIWVANGWIYGPTGNIMSVSALISWLATNAPNTANATGTIPGWVAVILPAAAPNAWADYQAGGDGTGNAPKKITPPPAVYPPEISVSPTNVLQGNVIGVSISHFTPYASVNISVYGGGGVNVTTDKNGSASTRFQVTDAPGNDYYMYAYDSNGLSADVPFSIYVAPPTVKKSMSTGEKIALGGGAVLLVAGIVAATWKK